MACGGAIYCKHSSTTTVTGCEFGSNNSHTGGAIFYYSSTSSIINCTFSDNVSMGVMAEAGALFFTCNSTSSVINCTFGGNHADYRGGAVSCWNSSALTFNNCILWDNSAASAGNEIFIGDSGSSCTLNYCCVDNTGYGFGSGVPTTAIDDSNNCILVDPQFVDAAGGDYHLKDTSPCIDAGDNSYVPPAVHKDMDGNKRIVDGNNDGTATVDIGAYEYHP